MGHQAWIDLSFMSFRTLARKTSTSSELHPKARVNRAMLRPERPPAILWKHQKPVLMSAYLILQTSSLRETHTKILIVGIHGPSVRGPLVNHLGDVHKARVDHLLLVH